MLLLHAVAAVVVVVDGDGDDDHVVAVQQLAAWQLVWDLAQEQQLPPD